MGTRLPPDLTILEELFRDSKTLVLRCRDAQGQSLVVKMPVSPIPHPAEIGRYRHAFRILQQINDPLIIRAYGLREYDSCPLLLLEDPQAKDAKTWLQERPFPLHETLEILWCTAQALHALHTQRIIHKDICPAHLLWNPETQAFRLIDFAISSTLTREQQALLPPKQLEGSLPFMSPEQTGRLNRGIDYRTDFYSLGATAYTLLTGQPPFLSDDSLEVLHAHLTESPRPPHKINHEIPPILSAIVCKLLAKQPEDRYQSAKGLSADLAACRDALRDHTAFPNHIALQDRPLFFSIPTKLYGRQAEIQQLLSAFDEAQKGQRRLVLLAGPSGIGKSALVQELHLPLAKAHSSLFSGRFESIRREVPYQAFTEALGQLFRQLLTEDPQTLGVLRQRAQRALSSNIGLLVSFVPEAAHLFGPTDAIHELQPEEAQHRAQDMFSALLRSLASPTSPLVFYLDDLQWADPASIELLAFLAYDPTIQGLLFLGGYRDNEIENNAPLQSLLQKLPDHAPTASLLPLSPLSLAAVAEMVRDACRCSLEEARPFAEILHHKTAGNAFFLRSLLKRLDDTGLLLPTEQGWRWDLQTLHHMDATDNVVSLMLEQLQRLPTNTREILHLAACIGHRFHLSLLAEAHAHTSQDIAQALAPALEHGMLFPENAAYRLADIQTNNPNTAYRFTHDRIQEAAHQLFPPAQTIQTHLRIGRILLAQHEALEPSNQLFAIIDHLRRAIPLLEDSERSHLIHLLCTAGDQAQTKGAHQSALDFFSTALGLLGPTRWQEHYTRTHDLTRKCAVIHHSLRQFDRMEILLDEIQQHALHLADQVPVWWMRLTSKTHTNQNKEALEIASAFLTRAGVSVPRSSHPLHFLWHLLKVQWALKGRDPEALKALPEATDPLHRGIQDIQTATSPAYLRSFPKMVPVTILRDVYTTLRYGTTAVGSLCWTGYGILLCELFGSIERGTRFGELSVWFAEKLRAPAARVHNRSILHIAIYPWSKPLREIIPLIEKDIKEFTEVGEREMALSFLNLSFVLRYYTGQEISTLCEKHNEIDQQLIRYPEFAKDGFFFANQQLLSAFAHLPTQLPYIKASHEDLQHIEQASGISALLHIAIIEIHLSLLFDDPQRSFSLAQQEQDLINHPAFVCARGVYWTYALIALFGGLAHGLPNTRTLQKRIRHGKRTLKRWCLPVSETRTYRMRWIEAAELRTQSHRIPALAAYEQALNLARRANSRHDAALIAEHAASLCDEIGESERAQRFRREAFAAYLQWGAQSKIKQLAARYPYLQDASTPQDPASSHPLAPSPTPAAISQRAREITAEPNQEKALRRLLSSALSWTGAKQGKLLLRYSGHWLLAAVGHSKEDVIEYPYQRVSLSGESLPLPLRIVRFVDRTHECVLLANAAQEGPFVQDTYVQQQHARSILCCPILHEENLLGLLLLENHLTTNLFTPQHMLQTRSFLSQSIHAIQRIIPHERPLATRSILLTPPDATPLSPTHAATLSPNDAAPASPRHEHAPSLLHSISYDAQPNRQIGDWILQQRIGEGGMSVVFEAYHQTNASRAALKLLKANFYEHPQSVQRFRREAHTMQRLSHPHIANILDYGQDPHVGDYIALELLQGQDLQDILQKTPILPISWLLAFTRQLCEALQYTHEAGIVHRDLKPSNLFFLPHQPFPHLKLLDFGIAKIQFHPNETQLTATGTIVGTPSYLAPEQLKEKGEITHATDLYALGVIWYRALTGALPIQGGSPVEQLVRILQEIPEPIGTRRPEFQGSDLEDLLSRLLAKDAQKRPSSALLLWDEIEMACQLLDDPNDNPERYPIVQTRPTSRNHPPTSPIQFTASPASSLSQETTGILATSPIVPPPPNTQT